MKKSVILILFWLFSIAIIFNKSYADFAGPITNWGIGVYLSSIALGDIDGDGDLDLIVSGNDGSSHRLDKYTNNGAGNFTGPYTNWGIGVCESSIALGDIDNDGDLDLIVSGMDTNGGWRLDKYINNTGNFLGPAPIGTGVQNSSIALADIDGDGDLDLIVSGYDGIGYRLDKYINNGAGNFLAPTNFGTGVYNSSIALGDIDNDGDLDLIVTGDDGSKYRLDKYINDGAGNFLGPTNFGTGVYWGSIALGDIETDGDVDLIVSGYSRLDKYTNNGTGDFSGTFFGTGVGYSSIALGDIDNDGDLDLIVSGRDGSGNYRLDKYTNNGAGNFAGPITNWGIGVCYSSIALGDIDNDGDLDLIVSGRDGNGNYRLDKYTNTCATANNPPNVPTSLNAIDSGGYWRFVWASASDDHTSTNLIRYKIAIGTNSSGVYDYISTNIDYPRGQANIGNVPQGWIGSTQCFYQSKIPGNRIAYWKVCSIDSAFKNSPYTVERTAIPSVVVESPPAPTNVSAVPVATNQINLVWSDVSNETSYTLFRNTSNDTNTATSIAGFGNDQTNYNDASLKPNTWYYYWVKAYNENGMSPFSEVASNITFPSTPVILSINAISTNEIYLVWNNIPNETGYTLFRNKTNNPNTAAKIDGFKPDVTSYTDKGLTKDTTYYYWVKAYNESGASRYSDVASATPSLPDTPSILEIKIVSESQLKIIWNDVPNETSYTLFRNTTDDTNTGLIKVGGTGMNQTEYIDSGLSKNIWYYYWVKAYNKSGESGYSDYKKGMIDLTLPSISINRESGIFVGSTEIMIIAKDDESGIEYISYTTDNSDPQTSSTRIVVQTNMVKLVLSKPTRLKVFARNNVGLNSETIERYYEILKAPKKDIMVYNNCLELSKSEPARIVIGKSGNMEIKIYDMIGNLVKEYKKQYYEEGSVIEWYGNYKDSTRKVGRGIYLVVIKGDVNTTMKIIVTK